MHDRIMQICTYDLFQFAYIPSWYEQLYELSKMAAPEPWRVRQPLYETQDVGTDDSGVCEMVIEMAVIYEKKGKGD